ncbi:MAG TPA: hypothetical protein DCS43_03805 [Verrucomicrobia bacterium]|nr:hypothetical protein [Verrucomicrobiota bacterium]
MITYDNSPSSERSDAETVQQILQWKAHDKYGFCFEIEKALARVLNDAGYALFVAHFRRAVEKGLVGLKTLTIQKQRIHAPPQYGR